MAFSLRPLTAEDAPRSVEIYFASFQNPHSLGIWPRIPGVRRWWEDMIRDELTEVGSQWLKAVHEETVEIAGYCKWRKFEAGHEADTSLPQWPEGADRRLADDTFGDWARKHPELMNGRAHWYLEMLATDPAYQGRGAGSQMMRWGLDRADAEGLEAYLEASPDAVRLYERFGFREASRTDTWIENERVKPGVWYRNLFMIRPAKGA